MKGVIIDGKKTSLQRQGPCFLSHLPSQAGTQTSQAPQASQAPSPLTNNFIKLLGILAMVGCAHQSKSEKEIDIVPTIAKGKIHSVTKPVWVDKPNGQGFIGAEKTTDIDYNIESKGGKIKSKEEAWWKPAIPTFGIAIGISMVVISILYFLRIFWLRR